MDKYKLINFCGCQSPQHAPVAQGIERQPPELKAAGSNPAGRTIQNGDPYADRHFIIELFI
jgi:hypothetical protein